MEAAGSFRPHGITSHKTLTFTRIPTLTLYVFCFREFYYIQMEKYARQAVSEGVKNADDLHVSGDSEIYRVLNLHYNRNNHIEVWGPQVRALPT
jgi:hypothetical protein